MLQIPVEKNIKRGKQIKVTKQIKLIASGNIEFSEI
jgi:hypothetical protein